MVFVARSGYGKTTKMVEFIRFLIKTNQIDPKRLMIFGKDKESDEPYKKLMAELEAK